MSKPTTVAKDWLQEHLPKSFKMMSETISAEQLATFSEEMTELKTRLDTQQEGNTKLKEDYDAEKVKNSDLAQKVTDLETAKNDLSTKLADTEKERNTYKEFYDEKANLGNKLPGADASDSAAKNKGELAKDHPMSILLSKAKG